MVAFKFILVLLFGGCVNQKISKNLIRLKRKHIQVCVILRERDTILQVKSGRFVQS